jgi:cytochrome P450
MRNPALDAWGDYDRDDPYPLFARVQADGPVHQVTLADGHRAWLIVRHEEAKAALGHVGLSKDMHAALARDGAVVAEGLPGPAFARHMLSVDRPDHTRLRRLATPAFSRPRIAALRPRVQAIAGRLLDDLEARGEAVVDLVQGFAFPLPFTVISELLGIPEPDRDRLGSWFTTLLTPSPAPGPPAQAVAASANIVRYLTGLLARKRAAPGEDLVTDLVRAADHGGALSEQEMLSTIFQLVVAGHDTTTSLIGNGTAALLAHLDQRDALVADPALVPHAIEEILRWDAPVPAFDVPVHHPRHRLRRDRHPGLRPGDHLPRRRRPGPGPVRSPGDLRHYPGGHQPPGLRPRHPPLPGRPAGQARSRDRAHHHARPLPRHATGHPTLCAALGPRRRTRPARPDRTASHPPPVWEAVTTPMVGG